MTRRAALALTAAVILVAPAHAQQTAVPVSALAPAIAAQIKAQAFAGVNLGAATVSGTPLSTIQSQAANAATQSALAGVASTANAALPAVALPSTAIRANFDDVARTLADRMSDHLNAKAFGAKGDGVTDDTVAFQNLAAVATGHIPTRIGVGLTAYLTALGAYFAGIGPFRNGGVKIDIPAGHYVLTAPITVNYAPNTAIHWRGDGSSMTELEFRGGIDGLVSNFTTSGVAQANAAERTGPWNGQAISVTGIHFLANTGIVPTPAYGGTNIGQGQGQAGAAIKTIAIPVVGASTPPAQIYDDLTFTNTGGWTDGANNWKYGLYLQDPDDLFVNRILWNDRSLGSNHTSTVIYVHSTSTATNSTGGSGHEFLSFDNMFVYGANAALQMDGNDIQGVTVDHLVAAYLQQGVVWLAGQDTLSGSLVIADSSIGAASSMVHVSNALTIYSHDNFYYNVGPPVGTDPIFMWITGTGELVSHGDQFTGPPPGTMGSGHTATAMFVSGYPSFINSPSIIANDTFANFDTAIWFGGGTGIRFANDVVSAATTTCYKDSSSGTAGVRPQFDGISCGATLHEHDGAGYALDYDWLPQRFMSGGLELGLPGVTSPGGVVGAAGLLDFHSQPNAAGTLAGLNDYDVRLSASGGTDGTSGQGTLNVYASQIVLNGATEFKQLVTADGGVNINGALNGNNIYARSVMATGSNGLQLSSGTSGNGPGSTNGVNWDASLIATGGKAGTNAQATLDIYAALIRLDAPIATLGGISSNTNWAPGYFPIVASSTMANLPNNCGVGGLVFVSDARKPGEAAGAGSGLFAGCMPSSKGGSTAWYGFQPLALSN